MLRKLTMWSIIFAVLAGTIPMFILNWYMGGVERRPVPRRQLDDVEIPSYPVQLKLMRIYFVIPAYIVCLGVMFLAFVFWRYPIALRTPAELVASSILLGFPLLVTAVCGIWCYFAAIQKVSITQSDITYEYGLGRVKVDLLDVQGFTERQSFIFIHLKNSKRAVAIPTSFDGLDILVKVLAKAKHGRIY